MDGDSSRSSPPAEELNLHEILKTILYCFSDAITKQDLVVSHEVHEYLHEFSISDSIESIEECLNPRMIDFVHGITDNFHQLE